jgi:hypothetical protein
LQLGALLGEAPNVLVESFIWLLVAAPKVLGIARAHVGALEVPHENLYEVGPVVDATGWEVLQPGSHRVSQEQRDIMDDEAVIVHAT